MGWVDALRGSIVGLDTGPLIYYIEEHADYLARLTPFFEAAERSEFLIVTSFVTLLEVLVLPLRQGRLELAQEYRDVLLHSANLAAIPLDESVAELAAELRGPAQASDRRCDPGSHSAPFRRHVASNQRYGTAGNPRHLALSC